MTTTLEELFDEASERCEFGFWIELDPEFDGEASAIPKSDGSGFRAIVAAILDPHGRSLFIEAGIDDESGPFVSVKGMNGSAEPVVLRIMATDTSALINLDE